MQSKIIALLADTGSLTKRFEQLMGVTPNLQLLRQSRELLCVEERHALSLKPRQMVLTREIKMGDGKKNWLFARTIIPLKTLRGSAKRLIHLKNDPIGKILFGRHGAKRTQMTISLTRDLPQTLINMGVKRNKLFFQRSSIFEFSSGPIMITEILLPDFPFYDD